MEANLSAPWGAKPVFRDFRASLRRVAAPRMWGLAYLLAQIHRLLLQNRPVPERAHFLAGGKKTVIK